MIMHFCSSACIVNGNNKTVLFVHHKKLNKWLFVGEHIEENEDPETAVLREVKEETNLDIQLLGERYPREDDFIRPFTLQRNIVKNEHIHIDLFYVALVKNLYDIKINNNELLNYKWFTRAEILNNNIDTFSEKKKMALEALDYVENLSSN